VVGRGRLARELHDELGRSLTAIPVVSVHHTRGGGSLPADRILRPRHRAP